MSEIKKLDNREKTIITAFIRAVGLAIQADNCRVGDMFLLDRHDTLCELIGDEFKIIDEAFESDEKDELKDQIKLLKEDCHERILNIRNAHKEELDKRDETIRKLMESNVNTKRALNVEQEKTYELENRISKLQEKYDKILEDIQDQDIEGFRRKERYLMDLFLEETKTRIVTVSIGQDESIYTKEWK